MRRERSGGLTDRRENEPLVPASAQHFTAVYYDRRGRGCRCLVGDDHDGNVHGVAAIPAVGEVEQRTSAHQGAERVDPP
jgi:hypothetical protein